MGATSEPAYPSNAFDGESPSSSHNGVHFRDHRLVGVVTTLGRDLAAGASGFNNHVYLQHTVDGRTFVLKVRRQKSEETPRAALRNDSIHVQRESRAAKRLAVPRYGGPRWLGSLRVQAPRRSPRLGMALDWVDGEDILKMIENGHKPKQAHVASLVGLFDRLREDGMMFSKPGETIAISPGDLIFTPSGHVVPIDVEPVAADSPNSATDQLQAVQQWISFLGTED